MFYSTGSLLYFSSPFKLILQIDPDISSFYRSLIPKYLPNNRPFYSPHLTIIRNETPPNLDFWNKYQDQLLTFEYENYIYQDETYYWLNAYSKELEDIREELGLPISSQYTKSPDGKHKFHITIANTKNL